MLAALLEIAPAGFEQVDGEDFVEFALYGSPGELPTFPEGEAEIGGVRVQVRGEEVPDDWEERWKRFHVPVLVGGKLWVRPPWEEPAVRPGVTEVVIDPGRAFGTGTHPTTRLCLELMQPRPRALIISGLLDEEADELAAAFAPLVERRRLSLQGWSALLLS